MKTVLNSFRIRLDVLQLAGTVVALGFACSLPSVKMPRAHWFELKNVNRPEHRRPQGTALPKPVAKLPVENADIGQEAGFEVAINFARTGVRPGKSPKTGTTQVQPENGQAGDSAL